MTHDSNMTRNMAFRRGDRMLQEHPTTWIVDIVSREEDQWQEGIFHGDECSAKHETKARDDTVVMHVLRSRNDNNLLT